MRAAADRAVSEAGWKEPYHVDADHINFDTVDRFLAASDFYTIDVADWIAKPADPEYLAAFVKRHPELLGELPIPGIAHAPRIDQPFLERTAAKYLAAVKEHVALRSLEKRNGSLRPLEDQTSPHSINSIDVLTKQ